MLAITTDMANLRAENVGLKQTMAVKVQEVQRKVDTGEGSATSSKQVQDLKIRQVKDEFPNPADKWAMGFLTVLSLDVQEASSSFTKMLATCQTEDGELDLSSSESQASMARAAYQV